MTKEKCTIRFLERKTLTKDKESIILKEINVIKELDHINIVKIQEFAMDEQYYYFVTE